MLINLSNHPSIKWETKQLTEANRLYGIVFDLPFPQIPPDADEYFIAELAEQYKNKCLEILLAAKEKNNAVHIMGELTFCFSLIPKLIKAKVICVASTTRRNATVLNGSKISNFEFVKFREYKKIS